MELYTLWLDNRSAGPFTLAQVKAMWFHGTLTVNTMYWMEGKNDWAPLLEMVNVLEGGPIVDSPTKINITTFVQPDSVSCTATVARMVAFYFGFPIEHQKAVELTDCGDDGSTLEDIAPKLAKFCKCKYRTLKGTITQIEKYLSAGFPILAGDDYTYVDPHAILIMGFDKNDFFLADPCEKEIKKRDKETVIRGSDEFVAFFRSV